MIEDIHARKLMSYDFTLAGPMAEATSLMSRTAACLFLGSSQRRSSSIFASSDFFLVLFIIFYLNYKAFDNILFFLSLIDHHESTETSHALFSFTITPIKLSLASTRHLFHNTLTSSANIFLK